MLRQANVGENRLHRRVNAGSVDWVVTLAQVLPLLQCPRCQLSGLQLQAAGLTCQSCDRRYPLFGGVACLMPDPELWRQLWWLRLEDFVAAAQARAGQLRQEAQTEGLLDTTRERLGTLADAVDAQRVAIEDLLSPLQGEPDPLQGAIPPRREDDGPVVLKCYEHVFRDWAWGGEETELARGLIERAATRPLGHSAVYGAGAGRLAVEIHRTLEPLTTLAFDLNPAPLLAARRLLGGEVVRLPEFPVAPHSAEHMVINHRLQYEQSLAPGLCLAFANALDPPLRAGALDTVISPWFIDAVQADVGETAALLNRVLRDGGTWINLGPLRFDAAARGCYAIDEVLELVARAGFEVLHHEVAQLPYFASPFGGSHRIDKVSCFAARKRRAAPTTAVPQLFPTWIVDLDLPIPVTPSVITAKRNSTFTSAVLSMIDGNRSVHQLAQELALQWRVEPAVVLQRLRAFLAQLHLR